MRRGLGAPDPLAATAEFCKCSCEHLPRFDTFGDSTHPGDGHGGWMDVDEIAERATTSAALSNSSHDDRVGGVGGKSSWTESNSQRARNMT